MQRFLTVTHASMISGLDTGTLIALGESGQIEMHPQTHLIDPASFSRWRENRHVQEKAESSSRQTEQFVQVIAALGCLQHQITQMDDRLKHMEQRKYTIEVL